MVFVHGLTKRFSEKPLFEHLSFSLPERGLYLLCGPNGCGKSPLLYILAGFDLNYTGDVLVDGEWLRSLDEDERLLFREKNLGLLFSYGNLFSFLNGKENIEYDAEGKWTSLPSGLMDKMPSVLSGGEEALLSLEVEFEKQKKIYRIDEFTSALNEENVFKAMERIHKQSEESLILMATHDKRILSSGTKIEMESLMEGAGKE